MAESVELRAAANARGVARAVLRMVHELQSFARVIRTVLLVPALSLGLALALPAVAHADGWWEVTCNSDGHEGDGGCSNPNNMSGCTCEAGHPSSSKRALSTGSGLALLAFVGYRIGRKRKSR